MSPKARSKPCWAGKMAFSNRRVMAVLRIIFADQLSQSITSLENIDHAQDTLLLCEVKEEATHVPHHPKKLAFLFSAMRHFAAELEARGARVRYVKLDDPNNVGSLTGEIKRAVAELSVVR